METVIAKHIEIKPGVCGGKPCIAGHRIRVQDIVLLHERQGMSPEDIVAFYSQLSLADVHAALAFYFDNRDLIRKQITEGENLASELQSRTPSKVTEKLQDGNPDDSFPS